MRAFCTFLITAGSLFLAGCGSTSATPPVSLTPPMPQILNAGETLNITAAVTNDPSKKGVSWSLSPSTGTLANETSTSVIYQAPDTVTGNFTVTVTAAAAADSSKTAPLVITVLAPGQGNLHPVSVENGPVAGELYLNFPLTSVLVCEHGTSICQVIGGILVDTGSSGLRILKSALNINLPPLTQSGGTVNNCISFVGQQFQWGEVAPADVYLAGESAIGISVQIIADPVGFTIPANCTNGGADADTQLVFPANGILGIGTEPTDCTFAGVNPCDPSSGSNPSLPYFVCFDGQGCAPTLLPQAQQVTNPIAAFAHDNNGSILEFPAVGTALPTVNGTLTFGINTQLNNALSNATVFAIGDDFFTTIFEGQPLTKSFIDSGSNELVFPNLTGIPGCSDGHSYCPASPIVLTAGNQGAQGVGTGSVTFQVDNFETEVAGNPEDAAFEYIAAGAEERTPCQNGQGDCMFDWGLPFFFGRKVFTSIDTEIVANQPKTPWWAY